MKHGLLKEKIKLNQGNSRATKTTMGAGDHQLRVVVVTMLRKVLSLNHEKILSLFIIIQVMNSNLLEIEVLNGKRPNIIIGV